MYSSLTISYYLIGKAKEDSIHLSALKLQKILYLAYGHYSAGTNDKLFSENIVAWQYGPVVQVIYQIFKKFGNTPLETLIDKVPEITSEKIFDAKCEINDQHRLFLDMIWGIYAKFTAGQLVELTHRDNTPWAQVTHNGTSVGRNQEIAFGMIKAHFDQKIALHAL